MGNCQQHDFYCYDNGVHECTQCGIDLLEAYSQLTAESDAAVMLLREYTASVRDMVGADGDMPPEVAGPVTARYVAAHQAIMRYVEG